MLPPPPSLPLVESWFTECQNAFYCQGIVWQEHQTGLKINRGKSKVIRGGGGINTIKENPVTMEGQRSEEGDLFTYRGSVVDKQTKLRIQGRSQKKLMTEAMSMEDLRPRQSVHSWVLFLGIKSVYNDYKQQKWKKLPRQVPRFACY